MIPQDLTPDVPDAADMPVAARAPHAAPARATLEYAAAPRGSRVRLVRTDGGGVVVEVSPAALTLGVVWAAFITPAAILAVGLCLMLDSARGVSVNGMA